MHHFTEEEFRLLLDDLLLYCGDGNVREITDTYGPTPFNGDCGGVIHTCMDSFKFTTAAFHDQQDYWSIDLPAPAACMTLGHRRITAFSFPKLHIDPAQSGRYRIANVIHYCYTYFSNMDENQRRHDLEQELGYHNIRTYGRVVARIEKDFRSFRPPYERRIDAPVHHN